MFKSFYIPLNSVDWICSKIKQPCLPSTALLLQALNSISFYKSSMTDLHNFTDFCIFFCRIPDFTRHRSIACFWINNSRKLDLFFIQHFFLHEITKISLKLRWVGFFYLYNSPLTFQKCYQEHIFYYKCFQNLRSTHLTYIIIMHQCCMTFQGKRVDRMRNLQFTRHGMSHIFIDYLPRI